MKQETYTSEELKEIQKKELEILKEIDKLCGGNNIEYFIVGGTALGAVRHKGFIPWDDDIDIGMRRAEYEKFLEIAPDKLDKKYYLQSPYTDNKVPYFFAKVRMNDTVFMEYCNRNTKMHHGIYVDVFPFDEVPDDDVLGRKHFLRVQRLIRWFTLKTVKDVSREPENIKQKLRAVVRRIIYVCASVIPIKTITKKLQSEITKYNGTNQQSYTCLNCPKYKGDMVLRERSFPLVECEFEDMTVYMPRNKDEYLRTHYGDYMQLPSENERVGHKPYRIQF